MMSIEKLQRKINYKLTKINTYFSLIIIDIDFFIRYCIRFSKKECNKVMNNIIKFFKEEFKDHKLYYDKTSDEFFIICLEFDDKSATEVMNEILKKFRKQRFAGFMGEEFKALRITFSAGIASYPHNGDKIEICRKATIALFAAKALRRNHIVSYNNTPSYPPNRVLYKKTLTISTLIGKWGEAGKINQKIGINKSLLWEPQAIAVSETGDLYIADQNNHQILWYNCNTIKPLIGNGSFGISKSGIKADKGRLNKPTGLYVHKDMLFITDTGNDYVLRIDLKTNRLYSFCGTRTAGYVGDGGSALMAALNKPGGIVVDKDNNVYINDIANNVIRKVDTKGIITTFAGNGKFGYSGDNAMAILASFNEIYGIGIDKKGENIYVADYFNHCVRRININSGIITTVAGCGVCGYSGDGGNPSRACLDRPVAVCLDDNNNLFIAESGNHCVRIVEANNNNIYTLAGGCGMGTGQSDDINNFQLANPNSLAVYKQYLYILDGANNRICKIDLMEGYDNE